MDELESVSAEPQISTAEPQVLEHVSNTDSFNESVSTGESHEETEGELPTESSGGELGYTENDPKGFQKRIGILNKRNSKELGEATTRIQQLEQAIGYMQQQNQAAAEPQDPNLIKDPTNGQMIDRESPRAQALFAMNDVVQMQQQSQQNVLEQKRQAERGSLLNSFESQINDAMEAMPDYQEVVNPANMSDTMREFALHVPGNQGAKFLHYLHKNQKLTKQISSLSPSQQMTALMKEMIGFNSTPVSRAAPPIASLTATPKSNNSSIANMSYEQIRERGRAATRGRKR